MELWVPKLEIAGLALAPILVLWLVFRRIRFYRPLVGVAARTTTMLATLLCLFFSLFLLSAQGCEDDR